ncbi:MAG: YicC family protein [Clostridia bacterium]|nr:YicC family protein [Clostridia bacterium]
MIKSMTGYGSAEGLFEKYKITVEVKTVNNRYLDTNIRTYKQYSFLEEIARECISKSVNRGKVDMFIQFEAIGIDEIKVTLNEGVALGFKDAVNKLSEVTGIPNNASISSYFHFPDMFTIEKEEKDKEQIILDAKKVIEEALCDLSSNRLREGERLKSFFDESIANVKDILSVIKERSPQTVDEYKVRMKERIEEILSGVQVDETRLLTEVGIFADKVNITEEIIRFESHLKEYAHLLESDAPVGRKLDFIIQELNRESNTMGSKCNDYIISKSVVDLKSEIEKLREQVQNIE